MTILVTRYIVKAGDDRATFTNRKDAERYASRCGKPRILTIPVTR